MRTSKKSTANGCTPSSRSVVGTTHAEDTETLVNRVIEQGLPPYLLREIDLVAFPRKSGGDRYVGEVVELLSEAEFDALDASPDDPGAGVIEKDGEQISWHTVETRRTDGSFDFAYSHPELGDDTHAVGCRVLHRIAAMTDRSIEDVEAEFRRKHRYVEYLCREGTTDFEELFDFLADLQTDEAATVERVR
jgi:hypothetical protein